MDELTATNLPELYNYSSSTSLFYELLLIFRESGSQLVAAVPSFCSLFPLALGGWQTMGRGSRSSLLGQSMNSQGLVAEGLFRDDKIRRLFFFSNPEADGTNYLLPRRAIPPGVGSEPVPLETGTGQNAPAVLVGCQYSITRRLNSQVPPPVPLSRWDRRVGRWVPGCKQGEFRESKVLAGRRGPEQVRLASSYSRFLLDCCPPGRWSEFLVNGGQWFWIRDGQTTKISPLIDPLVDV